MKKQKSIPKRINLYLEKDLMEAIGKKANESYLHKAAFIKQLLYVTLIQNENNKSTNLNEDAK